MNKCAAVIGTGVVLASAALGLAPQSEAGSWTMPNLIGHDLQGAQDAIQSLTADAVWYSGSTDLTGKGRMQIDDRNWVVCSSTPAPGRPSRRAPRSTSALSRRTSSPAPDLV